MAMHPMERRWSRRQFLQRAGGAAVALPSMAAILAACAKPGTETGGGSSPAEIPIATYDNPVTLPLNTEPIAANTPLESGPLVYYNWADYIYKHEVKRFEEKFGVDVEITTFNNMEEGIAKVESGQVQPDVFFPIKTYLRRLVQNDLVQPLQHELVPNIENMWPVFWQDPGPYYDQQWRYTVPYVTYNWGVAYRRDRVSDEELAAQGWDALWNQDYAGEISLYDSYGDTIAVAILRNGSLDVNTGDPDLITAAKDAILQTIDENGAKLTINGVYAKLPAGDYTVAEAWSGDIVGAQWYLPKDVKWDVLGYWRPEPGKSMTDNDLMTIPMGAKNPRLAHEFVNFFLDERVSYDNFRYWNGYQPPLTSIDPDKLIADEVVPPSLPMAVVSQDMFREDLTPYEVPPEDDQLWQAAWTEIKAGA